MGDGVSRKFTLSPMAKKKTPQAPAVSITLRIDNQEYKGEGATILEALKAMPKPFKTSVKGTLSVIAGNLKTTQYLTPARMRLFCRPVAAIYQAKNLQAALK